MRHLQPRTLKAALDVEALVRLAAVQDALIAAHFRGDEVERLDDLQSELFALLVFRDGDVFDVSDEAEVVDAGVLLAGLSWSAGLGVGVLNVQFLLNNQCPSAYYPLSIFNHKQIICPLSLCVHKVVAFVELLFCDVADGCQHS
jgi:hypothetical protein